MTEREQHRLRFPDRRTVDVNGPVRMGVWDGPGDRTYVLLHGLGETHVSWLPVSEALSDRGRVLAPDMPGFGLSPRAGRSAALGANVSLIARLLDEVVGRPVVLMGTSYGGGVAALVASRHPELVSGLVLSSSYLPPDLGGVLAPVVIPTLLAQRLREGGRVTRMAVRYVRRAPLFVEAAVRAAAGDSEEVPEDAVDAIEEVKGEAPDDQLFSLTMIEAGLSLVLRSTVPWRVVDAYREIDCPVLVVHGSDDREVPVGWAWKMKERCPRWSLEVIEGGGHVLPVEEPDRWCDAVLPWLERHQL